MSRYSCPFFRLSISIFFSLNASFYAIHFSLNKYYHCCNLSIGFLKLPLDSLSQLLFLKVVTALGVPGDYCLSPESYSKAALAVDNLLFFGEWSSSNCSCTRQCNQDYFLPYTETSVIENKLGRLRVFFQVS